MSGVDRQTAVLQQIGADVKQIRQQQSAVASSTFVPGAPRLTRVGSTLSTRLVGANIYDLLLSDKTNTVQRLTTAEVKRRYDAVKDMGANIVRTHAWISYGKTLSIMPTMGNYDESALVALDVIVAEARNRNLMLWACMTDRWNFFHGGSVTFAQLSLGHTGNTDNYYRDQFFNTTTIINQFKNYLTTVLTRTNTITGVKYINDPTLAVIETINEGYDAPASWTTTILSHLRSIAPGVLLADGTNATSGRYPDGTNSVGAQDGANSLTQDCDIVGTHFYDTQTRNAEWLDRAADMAAHAPSPKAYVVGEWGWTEQRNGFSSVVVDSAWPSRASFCQRMESNQNVQGDMYWSLMTDPSGATHDDGYQLYVPPQNQEQSNALDDLERHAYQMRERVGKWPWQPTVVQTDTFDGSGLPDSVKWTTYLQGAAASAMRVSDKLTLVTGTAGGYSARATVRSMVAPKADRKVNFTVTPTNVTDEAYFRVSLRGQGAGALVDGGDGYILEINNSGAFSVKVRLLGADTSPKVGGSIPGWGAGVAMNIEFEVSGNTAYLRYWLASGTRPSESNWNSVTDKIKAAGATALTLNGGNATTSVTWTIDNWTITDLATVYPNTIPHSHDMSEITGGMLIDWPTVAPPSPPTGGLMFTRFRARRLPAFVGPMGQDTQLQPAVYSNRMAWSLAVNAVAGLVASGFAATAYTAATAVSLASTNFFSGMTRTRFPLAAPTTAQSVGGYRSTTACWFCSTTANLGGFFFVARFGMGVNQSTSRMFVGLSATAGALAMTANPSALFNMFGIGADDGDTQLQFMCNDGSGTATKVPLGANFPAKTAATDFYEVRLFSPSGAGNIVFWSCQRLSDGALAQGQVATDLPPVGTLLAAQMVHGNGATATATAMDIQQLYIETDN